MSGFATPGKSNAQATFAPQQQQSAATPGKATLIDPVGSPSQGNRGAVNFLGPAGRARLENLFGLRVGAAQIAFFAAIGDERTTKLMEQVKTLSVGKSLAISMGTKLLEAGLTFACGFLVGPGAAAAELAAAKVVAESEPKILGLNPKVVEAAIGFGADKGKEVASEAATEAQNEPALEEKTAAVSFIDYVRDDATMLFQHLREGKIQNASDAVLLAAYIAYDGSRWTTTICKTKIHALVELYLKSHAKDIGHKTEKEWNRQDNSATHLRKETRVAWLLGPGAQKLIYVEKVFDLARPALETMPNKLPWTQGGSAKRVPDSKPGDAYNAPENALGLEEEGPWHDPNGIHDEQGFNVAGREFRGSAQSDPFAPAGESLGQVEPELEEAALAAHRKRWLQEPQRVMQGPYGLIAVGGR